MTLMKDKAVCLEVRGNGIAVVYLNRANTLNALDTELLIQLKTTLVEVEENNDIQAVILTGKGKGFCSGANLSGDLLAGGEEQITTWINDYANAVIRYIRSMSTVVIAAVNGAAAGAGISLAFGCDMVISSTKARYYLSFANVGMAMDMGASWLLTHKIGAMKTAELAMTGDSFNAETAHQWGLSNKTVEHEQLLSESVAFAEQIVKCPSKTLAMLKSQITLAQSADLSTVLEYEAKVQGILANTNETQSLIKQFAQGKR